MPVVLIVVLVYLVVWTPYLGSWVPPVYGFPFGAFVRDLLLGAVIYYAYYRFITEKKIPFHLMPSAVALVYLSIFVLVLVFGSEDKVGAVTGARSFVLFPAAFLAAVFLLWKSGSRSLREKIESAIVFNSFAVAVISILDVLTLGELKIELGYNPEYAGGDQQLVTQYNDLIRANGGFGDALNVGYFLSLGVLMSISLLSRRENRTLLARTTYGTVALLSSIGVVMTLTRGAMMCIVIAYAAYFFPSRRSGFLRLALFCLVTLAVSYVFVDSYSETLLGRFTDSDPTSSGSSQGRVTMALRSLEYLSDHPNGVGLGTQGSASRFSNVDQRINTDNYFFWAALEMGLMGFLLNLIFISAQFWLALTKSADRRFSISVTLMYFISAMLSSAPTAALYSVPFWLLLASKVGERNQFPLIGANEKRLHRLSLAR